MARELSPTATNTNNKYDEKTSSSSIEINPENSDPMAAGNDQVLDQESGGTTPQCSNINIPEERQKDLWMELEDFFECFRYHCLLFTLF